MLTTHANQDRPPRLNNGEPPLEFNPDEAPQFLKMLARSLATMRAYGGAQHALARGQLTARDREEIALAVAEINGAKVCLESHANAARKIGLAEEDIELARHARATDASSQAMLTFTLAVVLQRGEIKRQDLKALREAGFSDSEILEIVANIAMNIFANYLNLVAKTEPDLPAAVNPPERNYENKP